MCICFVLSVLLNIYLAFQVRGLRNRVMEINRKRTIEFVKNYRIR